jgi:kynurenine formamidase
MPERPAPGIEHDKGIVMENQDTGTGRVPRAGRKVAVAAAIVAAISVAGVAGASFSGVTTTGSGEGRAVVKCPGGMSRLGHEFNEDISVFPFDPAIHIENVYTVADDGFKVERVTTGTHAGTHLDVPAHFVEDGRSIEELAAEEFVWPAYKIDVRGMTFDDNLIQKKDIKAYEKKHGKIKPGSLVILQTGAEKFYGLDGPGDQRGFVMDDDGNVIEPPLADNIDDLFDFVNPGFSGDAVQWMFNARKIDGVGSDAYGPDAATDENFDATFTTLDNDGVALVALANLDSVGIRSDVIMASGIPLTDGSGFSTDPIACHGAPSSDHDDDWKDD